MSEPKDEMLLRQLLWLRHGCPLCILYGDDGEMECNKCSIDFKRDSAERIEARFMELGMAKLKAEQEGRKP